MREHAVESSWRSSYNRMLTHGGSEARRFGGGPLKTRPRTAPKDLPCRCYGRRRFMSYPPGGAVYRIPSLPAHVEDPDINSPIRKFAFAISLGLIFLRY